MPEAECIGQASNSEQVLEFVAGFKTHNNDS